MTISIIENSNCNSTHDLGIVTGVLLHCCWALHTPLVAQEAVLFLHSCCLSHKHKMLRVYRSTKPLPQRFNSSTMGIVQGKNLKRDVLQAGTTLKSTETQWTAQHTYSCNIFSCTSIPALFCVILRSRSILLLQSNMETNETGQSSQTKRRNKRRKK